VTVYSTSHQLVILARELRPRCSTVAGEERLTSSATIGLSAMYQQTRLVHHHRAEATLEQMVRPSEPMLIAAV
jgi:hypothetical protein